MGQTKCWTCQHCYRSWFIDRPISFETAYLLKRCRAKVTADAVKALRVDLNLGLLESKYLAMHASNRDGTCFNCGVLLKNDIAVITSCSSCGAVNLELQNV